MSHPDRLLDVRQLHFFLSSVLFLFLLRLSLSRVSGFIEVTAVDLMVVWTRLIPS